MTAPIGTTHTAEFYGTTLYYKCVPYNHLNQVCEEWQTWFNWYSWDLGKWNLQGPGSGFSARTLQEHEPEWTRVKEAYERQRLH